MPRFYAKDMGKLKEVVNTKSWFANVYEQFI